MSSREASRFLAPIFMSLWSIRDHFLYSYVCVRGDTVEGIKTYSLQLTCSLLYGSAPFPPPPCFVSPKLPVQIGNKWSCLRFAC